jgi:protein TonB
MSAPAPKRVTWLPAHLLKPLAIAFGIGLLLFLLLWLDQRRDDDFFKAGGPTATGASDVDGSLPAPIPADIAGEDGNASRLGLPRSQAPAAEQPRIVNEPPPPAPPPIAPPAPAPTPGIADSDVPIPVNRPAPRYPPEALRRGVGGTVRVRVVVAADGSVERMDIAEASGNRHLDRAALEAVRRWTFKPAVRGGRPVSAEVIVPLEFNPGG